MDFLDRLKEAGFQVNPFKWWADKAFADSNNKHGLLQDECICAVSKSE
jgi:hypothetical protein